MTKKEIIDAELEQPLTSDYWTEDVWEKHSANEVVNPSVEAWSDESVRGLIIFHMDALDESMAEKMEDQFKTKYASLLERLAEQGIESMIFFDYHGTFDYKENGAFGVRVEYFPIE